MYKEHKAFDTPEDDKKIWRYMDFTKFVDILDKSQLFFPTANKLGDPLEGSYTKASIDYRNANIDNFFREETWNIIPRENFEASWSKISRNKSKDVAISCWNISEDESDALWQLYCSGQEGIAIQSTIGHLKESLKQEDRDIYIGKVNYVNHIKELKPQTDIDLLRPFLDKGISHKYEEEVRAVIDFPPFVLKNNVLKPRRMTGGYYATTNPDLLIEEVFISPRSPKWKRELVRSVLLKYRLNKRVHKSDLTKKPLF